MNLDNLPENTQMSLLLQVANRFPEHSTFIRRKGDYDVIEWGMENGVYRTIKVDSRKSCVIVYTYVKGTSINEENQEKNMFFTAHVNEGLSVTGLELDLDHSQYRYKSSQAFPGRVDPTEVLNYFLALHDKHFPILREYIIKLQGADVKPLECAQEFLESIKAT